MNSEKENGNESKSKKRMHLIPTALASIALSTLASVAANKANDHDPSEIKKTVAAIAERDPGTRTSVGIDDGKFPAIEIGADNKGKTTQTQPTTHAEHQELDATVLREDAFHYSDDPAAHKVPTKQELGYLHDIVQNAVKDGSKVDSVTIQGMASDEGNTYGPNGEILPDAGLGIENQENSDLADTYAHTAGPAVEKTIEDVTGKNVKVEYADGLEKVDPEQAKRIADLARDEDQTALGLIADYKYGDPASLSPEVREALDAEHLEDDRGANVTVKLSKQVTEPGVETTSEGEDSSFDVVPVVFPIPTRRRNQESFAAKTETKEPQVKIHTDPAKLSPQFMPPVYGHQKQPRNQNFSKNTAPAGRMARTSGGDRSGKRG